MTVNVTRRQFFKLGAAGVASSSMAMMGFAPESAEASVRQFKLTHARETRNNCTYCSVGCGILIYSHGDGSKNVRQEIFHIEGDPDHPVSRGSLCPKGSGLLDFVRSETRLEYPQVRAPGSSEWKRVSWDEALDRIARHIKKDRDANFVERDETGRTVNHWTTSGFLAASGASNEAGYITHKVVRNLGMVAFDNQARV
ncbi:formate dehydrogenase (quinone-dependent) catalytic subunit [Kushneria avicenniae]|uniref:Formate dehydrogenase (Quinone-dependent) catalytic subunit n=3 Tax=Kushneria avicenniae TaxID=402385 RepID=A0A1I1MHT0_9GAMM|nr:formate dehydrogenase (quinone-dependent) catalytic subunit [Kushneria avicenniae]